MVQDIFDIFAWTAFTSKYSAFNMKIDILLDIVIWAVSWNWLRVSEKVQLTMIKNQATIPSGWDLNGKVLFCFDEHVNYKENRLLL